MHTRFSVHIILYGYLKIHPHNADLYVFDPFNNSKLTDIDAPSFSLLFSRFSLFRVSGSFSFGLRVHFPSAGAGGFECLKNERVDGECDRILFPYRFESIIRGWFEQAGRLDVEKVRSMHA